MTHQVLVPNLVQVTWTGMVSILVSMQNLQVKSFLTSLETFICNTFSKEHGTINKSKAGLNLLLTDWKFNYPEIFWSYLCVTPPCFDDILKAIIDDDVFQNNSQNEQDPVNRQHVVALF
jgi:hypothetical protein